MQRLERSEDIPLLKQTLDTRNRFLKHYIEANE
jgi:hypothetical protein